MSAKIERIKTSRRFF